MSDPEHDPQEMEVQKALADYMEKCDSGIQIDRAEFLAQHPELEEQLNELLSVADWIEDLAGPRVADLAGQSPSPQISSPEPSVDPNEETSDLNPQFATLVDQPQSVGFIDETTDPLNRTLSASQPVLPCRFGDYSLERILGRGGMGVVYAGRQVKLDRPVAVKMIRSGALASEQEVSRFYAEARSAAKLDHPNIVTVYQCGQHNGHHFFSMDYVDGMDLSKMMQDEPLDPQLAARYVRDAARAIQYAHERGIVHRDLKPANLLVDSDDNVRITDFGLAKSIDTDSGLTATGAAIGTPSYMSPEQAAGQVDQLQHSTDVYSLGAILFATAVGRPPFKAATVVQTIMQVIHRPHPAPSSINPVVKGDLETIIDVCLQKAPERRYKTAAALADDLDRYLIGAPIEARPMGATRRAWYWLLGVPIFGAVLDHRVVEPTDAHRWVQRGLISVTLLLLLAWLLFVIPTSVWYKNRMPSRVAIAAGIEGGSYHSLANRIGGLIRTNSEVAAEVVTSGGSADNLAKLRRGEVDLALLQADAMDSSVIAVVAPMYYEVVHILTRKGLNITSLQQLRGLTVKIGSQKGGSYRIARAVLEHAGVSLTDVTIDESPLDLQAVVGDTADAAIVVARLGSPLVHQLLESGHFQLFNMRDAWQFTIENPSFHVDFIRAEHYPECSLPDEGLAAVATTAFLAAKSDTSAQLVRMVLQNLYTPENVAAAGILSPSQVARWKELAWHPASREFFGPYRASTPSASK